MDHSAHSAMGHVVSDIAVCIMVAWLMAVGAQLLRQPLILAYLLAGFVIGPIGYGFIKDESSIETISGLGLMLLLFMIGLEIDLKKMMSAGKSILISSLTQILGCCLLGLVFFWAIGFALKKGHLDALYLAVAAAMSSTVIIVKILYEKRELDTLSGRITLGVLVLQDLFAILFLAIQPELKNPSVLLVAKSLGKVGILVVVAFTASRYVLPPLFKAVARLPELVLVGALSWCFLVAGLASALDLSREMGALVAGIAISTFPYTLDVTSKVTTLRDFFVTLFFVALGMKIPHPTLKLVAWSVLIAAFVVFSRFITIVPILYRMKMGHRASLLPAINLCQISELSLVLLTLGLNTGDITDKTIGVAAYAFALLAILSTYGIVNSDKILLYCSDRMKRMGLRDLDEGTSVFERHRTPSIFLLGFSWTASSLLEEISRKAPDQLLELAIIDFNPQAHHELKRRGFNAIYGDISQSETLIHAGVGEAKIIVCTLPNTVLKGASNLRILQQLRHINPTASIVVHADLFEDVPKLYEAGASYVSVPRLIEASDLFRVIDAAKRGFIDDKTAELKREMQDRKEVIP